MRKIAKQYAETMLGWKDLRVVDTIERESEAMVLLEGRVEGESGRRIALVLQKQWDGWYVSDETDEADFQRNR